MGFFSKLKDNMGGSGIDVKIEAPATAQQSDPFIPTQVTITNNGDVRNISRIYVELHRTSRNKSADTSATPTAELVARVENNQPFMLQSGQQQIVQMQLVLNKIEAVNEQMPDNEALKGFVQGLSNLQKFTNALDDDSYTYEISAVADIEGVAFDPRDRQPIQILKPGQFGGGLNVRL